MKTIEASLAAYIEVLASALESTRQANDRPLYEKHLAMAARMFAAARKENGAEELRKLVAQERRSFGCAYLAGEEGERAERAFDRLAKLVEGAGEARCRPD